MFNEKIPPLDFYDALIHRKNLLEKEYKEINKRIAQAPKGNLVIYWDGKRIQYFLKPKRGDKKRIYIHKNEKEYIQKLAQKSFDQKMKKRIRYELNQINRLEKFYKKNDFAKLYSKMGKIRQTFVEPLTIPDSTFIEKWLEIPYEGLEIKQGNAVFITQNNEKVRSKSEFIIANALSKNHIPYKYEIPLTVKDKMVTKIIHPDFCCLDVKNRKEIIWEHFGMMDDINYANNAIKKVQTYSANGYSTKNIIYTWESKEHPLTPEYVEQMIKSRFVI